MKEFLQKNKDWILYQRAIQNKSLGKFSSKDFLCYFRYKLLDILKEGKDFLSWTARKEKLENKKKIFYASPRDIVWIDIGTNIGSEISGHGKGFCRPALILKKYGNLFLVTPITGGGFVYDKILQTWVIKDYHHKIKSIQLQKESFIILSQLKTIDVRRIKGKMLDNNKKGIQISQEEFDTIRQKLSKSILE